MFIVIGIDRVGLKFPVGGVDGVRLFTDRAKAVSFANDLHVKNNLVYYVHDIFDGKPSIHE